MWLAAREPRLDFPSRHVATVARIERRAIRVRATTNGRPCDGNLLAAGKAGVQQAQCSEPAGRGLIGREMLGLPSHRLLPRHAEPGEVAEYRVDIGLRAADRINVLDPEQIPAAEPISPCLADERSKRVADVQQAVRARREAQHGRDGTDHLLFALRVMGMALSSGDRSCDETMIAPLRGAHTHDRPLRLHSRQHAAPGAAAGPRATPAPCRGVAADLAQDRGGTRRNRTAAALLGVRVGRRAGVGALHS